jgi:CO/xanthine dehydrogenase FAD-binding subunit
MGEGEFYKAKDLQEACDLLARYGAKACILAGGTDLMVQVNRRLLSPEVLIYIGGCGLDYIKEEGGKLVIGAATPHAKIVRSELVQKKAPLLAQVVGTIGSTAIQNQGTIGGNLGNASPAADSAVALLALGASLKLKSAWGERLVAAADFFTGPGKTVLQADELVQEVIIPAEAPALKWAFRKIGKRRADVCSTVSVAVAAQMDGSQCKDVRVALGSVAPTPLLSKKAPEMLVGKKVDSALAAEVAKAVAGETSPIDDVRATAWYRRRASEVLVKELLGAVAAG